MKFKTILILFLVVVFVTSFTYYLNNQIAKNPTYPIVFSEQTMISELWKSYKREYVELDTFRTVDKQRENITTSEGQSYTMLRAVWMGDKETFDKSWKWTKDILKRNGKDNLFAWLFGQKEDGSYGIKTDIGGYNTASDADQDIALALIFAYKRWSDEQYLREAKEILKDLWDKEVINLNGQYYLASNDIEKLSSANIVINPSYFAPYAYKIFAKIDPERDWLKLVDGTYNLLEKSNKDSLDKDISSGLTPDWVLLNRSTGEFELSYPEGLTSNFSYDAIRTVWRLSLDWVWFKDERAKKLLEEYEFLNYEWERNRAIYSVYGHDGVALSTQQSHATYGATIGYFSIIKPEAAQEIYNLKLKPLYSPDNQGWLTPLGYYDDNWAWFGISLYLNKLPNLAENI